ncbi:hypothetical protein RRG08_058332 [Elysia crispata]|uniref:Uncharacterized protein n=1 Tax=Elysia crispata TaxID=231223 RepID=A0AAE1B3T5_9GAST|nr:hypothetical protein RRG08_058332 [Elysia crispata]
MRSVGLTGSRLDRSRADKGSNRRDNRAVSTDNGNKVLNFICDISTLRLYTFYGYDDYVMGFGHVQLKE